jgi:lysophospholipase L1-like esterase
MAAMKRWLGNLTALGVGLVMSVGAAELMLRLVGLQYPSFYRLDPQRGYGLRPGASGLWSREGHGQVRINAAGFRGAPTRVEPQPGRLRLAVLGDSFTEALQLDEPNTLVGQLQRQLSVARQCRLKVGHPDGVEVLNFGVGGYGTAQAWLTWRHLARSYRPDLVLLLVYPGNDLNDNEPLSRPDRPVVRLAAGGQLVVDNSFRNTPGYRWRTSLPGQLLEGLINHSRVLQLLNEGKNRMANQPAPPRRLLAGQPPAPTPPASAQAWAITDALIANLNRDVAASGARMVVASASSPDQLWPRPSQRPPDPFASERRLQALLAAQGIPYLALAPLLQQQADQRGLTLHGFTGQAPGQGHWNASGHRLAATALIPWLCGL